MNDRLELNHLRILASAGSGKTFQLTSRYLQLIAAGAAPETIFASTFTRLAAGEIRNRIFERLANARSGERLDELAEAIGLGPLTAAQVQTWFAELARNAHLLRIGTLDGFFAAIAGAFADVVGAPADAVIVDEEMSAHLQREALLEALDQGDPDVLVELMRRLTMGDAGRGIMFTLLGVVERGHALWRESDASSWDCVPKVPGRLDPPDLDAAIRLLQRSLAADEEYWCQEFRHALTDPDLDSIREDPRVKRLMDQLRRRGLRGIGATTDSPFSGQP